MVHRARVLLLLLGSAIGCGKPKEPVAPQALAPGLDLHTAPNKATTPAAAPPESSIDRAGDPAPATAPDVTEATAIPKASEPEISSFPPADVSPPFDRTAREGDGHWQPFGNTDLGELAGNAPHVIYQTTLHPHPASRYHSLAIVAIDLDRARIGYMPGSDDEGVARLPKDLTPGLVPQAEQERLLAVFNGGFQIPHGHWGMMSAGKTLAPPRDIGCTLALYRDGSVRLAPWIALQSTRDAIIAFRQTPPCLLDNGAVHHLLVSHQDRLWAGKNPKEITRRRSAVGLSENGRVLFYGVGVELDALQLAEAMKLAGATQAAELDINWNWTRFLLFGHSEPNAAPTVTSTLLEGMEHNSRSYVGRVEARDFFYLLLEP